jgi:hypothetical protein
VASLPGAIRFIEQRSAGGHTLTVNNNRRESMNVFSRGVRNAFRNSIDLLHALSRSEDTTVTAVTHDLSIAGRTDMTFRLAGGKLVKNSNGLTSF